MPIFVQIEAATAEISRYIALSRWRPRPLNIISGFVFVDVTALCLQKVKVYQQTKFRRYISIDGWDITTSRFEIQTSAILELYFRFRSRPVRRNLHVILHQVANFVQIGAPTAELWRHIRFSEGQSLSANQISSRYLNWRLRYNYFRFRNTNVCHIGILLPVSISTISP